MAEKEQNRLILVDTAGAVELTGATNEGEALLGGVRIVLEAGRNSRLLKGTHFDFASLVQRQEEPEKLSEPPKYYPAIPLADEMDRQRHEATERVAVPLGIDRNRFQAQLPTRFPDRPAEHDTLHLNVPLLALDLTSFGFTWLQVTEAALFYDPKDPRTALKAYIWNELRTMSQRGKLQIWEDPREGIIPFPQIPHAFWIQNGTRYVNRKPKDVRGQLHQLERAGDHFKGTSLAVLRPDMVKLMFWDLIGGQVGSDGVPCVGWDGRPGFDYGWDGAAGPEYRALVGGSEFTVA